MPSKSEHIALIILCLAMAATSRRPGSTPISPRRGTRPPVSPRRGTRPPRQSMRWVDRDMHLFMDEVESLGLRAEDVLKVYAAESGLDPAATSDSAFGIPQLTRDTAKAIGWQGNVRDFAKLSVGEQIPWITKLLAAQIRSIGYVPQDALELYIANFCPRAARDRDNILYRSDSEAYKANWRLDRANKGYISSDDLADSLRQVQNSAVYQTALEQVRRIRKAHPS